MSEPKTHDYTELKRRWGHDLMWSVSDGGRTLKATGWGTGINPEDFLLLTNPQTKAPARYRVESITYEFDPPDMWSGVLKHAPRESA